MEKIKNDLTSFKNSINLFIKNTKSILSDNKLVVIYFIGATLNGLLVRTITIGKIFSLRPLLADFVISLLFVSLYFFIQKKYRFYYLIFISIVSTIVCIANALYYSYYSSYISITFLSFALANHDTGGANVLGSLINPKFFIFLWLVITLIIVRYVDKRKSKEEKTFRKANKKTTIKTTYIWVLVITIVFLLSLKPIDFGRLYSQWNREYLVSRFGVYTYQINDIVKSIEPKVSTLFGKDKSFKEINDFYEKNKSKAKKNEYTNLFKDKSVIAVHAESIQRTLINLKINGKEITPNLNRLAKEGIYFDNFYSQVSFGTSSDTEFTLATSLLPVSSGTVFINYSDRDYQSFYKLLKDKGYYTFSMHANTGDFWNRNVMHKNLGYDKFYDKSSYTIDEEIGFGLSDRSFIIQSVNYIKEIKKEHDKFYGTLITLSNHTPFDYDQHFKEFDVTIDKNGKKFPYMKDTKLGNYFVSAHYADEQLGLLIDLLEKEKMLDDTIILIYGDHDARISTMQWNRFYNYNTETDDVYDEDDKEYTELDYYWQEINRRVPAIIWTSDKKIQDNYGKTISTVMGMYDLGPTLSNMLGIYNPYALGSDIMNMKDNLVVFPNGNFVTNYIYYNDNKDEYKLLKEDTILDNNYINDNKEESDRLIDISNDIIVYNYFKNKFATNYEEEK